MPADYRVHETRLTMTEKLVLACLANGLTKREAAVSLDMSYHTLRTHVEVLRDKLGARNVAHAVYLFYGDRHPAWPEAVSKQSVDKPYWADTGDCS